MTDDEAKEYRKLLDRKKKALSLPDAEREKFMDEYNRIVSAVNERFTEYCFYKIGLEISEENEEILCMFFDMDKLWSMLIGFRDSGKGEKIDAILDGMKCLYAAVKGAEN